MLLTAFVLATLSPDGTSMAAVPSAAPRTAVLVDVGTGRLLRTFTGPSGRIRSLAFTPDGRGLAAGANDRSLRRWQVADGRTTWVLAQAEGVPRALAFSPDGRTLATGDDGYTIVLRRAADGRRLASRTQRDRIHFGLVHVAFSADGTQLVGAGDDELVSRWRVPQLDRRRDVDGWPQGDFATDGRTLAFRNGGGLRTIALPFGAPRTWKTTPPQDALAVSPDGKALLLGERWPDGGAPSSWRRFDFETGRSTPVGGPQSAGLTFVGAAPGRVVGLTPAGALRTYRW